MIDPNAFLGTAAVDPNAGGGSGSFAQGLKAGMSLGSNFGNNNQGSRDYAGALQNVFQGDLPAAWKSLQRQPVTSTNVSADDATRALGAMAPRSVPSGPLANSSDTEAYIRNGAVARGIDPDIAVRVAKSEGLNEYVGDNGSSFGPFQLHYGGMAGGSNAVGGLGDKFTAQTGLHASDRSTVRNQIDFALDYASKYGWGPWHGWKGAPFAGIKRGNVESGLY